MEQIYQMMNNAIDNLSGAIEKQNSQLTKAVLINLQAALPSYIDALQDVEL